MAEEGKELYEGWQIFLHFVQINVITTDLMMEIIPCKIT